MSERRRHQRAQKNIAIKLRENEFDFVTETKNISCLGAYCSVDAYIPILTKIKITLLVPKVKGAKTAKSVTCEGTVVRVERCRHSMENNKHNLAIYFSHISKSDMKLIDDYVKSTAANAL